MPLLDSELGAEHYMRTHLGDLLDLADQVHDLMASALSALPDGWGELSCAHRVATNLLIRLCNDLRVTCILVLRGYPIQALSNVAGTFEVAHTVAYIGSDDALALEWIKHNDPAMSFRKVKPLLHGSLAKCGFHNIEAQLKVEYKAYRQMCWAKHANPYLQKDQGIQRLDQDIALFNGPDTSPGGTRLASFSLQHASRLCVLALASYAAHHLEGARQQSIINRVKILQLAYQQIVQAAVRQWGTEDPFPGRW